MFKEFLNSKLNKTYVNDRTGERSNRRVVNGKYVYLNRFYKMIAPITEGLAKFKYFKFKTVKPFDVVKVIIGFLLIPYAYSQLAYMLNFPPIITILNVSLFMELFFRTLLQFAIVAYVIGRCLYGIYNRGTSDYDYREQSYPVCNKRVITTVLVLSGLILVAKIFL